METTCRLRQVYPPFALRAVAYANSIMPTPHKQPEGDCPQPLTRSDLVALVLNPLAQHMECESAQCLKLKVEILSQIQALNDSVEIIAQGMALLLQIEE